MISINSTLLNWTVNIVEKMLIVYNFSSVYSEALIAATPKELLANGAQGKKNPKLSAEDIARRQREMETLQKELVNHEDTYGQNFLNLVIVRGYLSKLLDNGRVVRFLSANHSDILDTFQQIVESTSLYDRFSKIVKDCKTMEEAVLKLNKDIFEIFNVQYHATKCNRPNQGPYESNEIGYASCSSLTILITDACRAVCIPARFTGVLCWQGKPENHCYHSRARFAI